MPPNKKYGTRGPNNTAWDAKPGPTTVLTANAEPIVAITPVLSFSVVRSATYAMEAEWVPEPKNPKRPLVKIKIVKTKDKIFSPETSLLRLGNFKSNKYLKWHPKWSLEKSLKKVLDWYYLTKTQNPRNVCENQIREFIEIN